jgi:hypothetical protein
LTWSPTATITSATTPARAAHGVVHLHRFHRAEQLPCGHGIARLHGDRHDIARQRRGDDLHRSPEGATMIGAGALTRGSAPAVAAGETTGAGASSGQTTNSSLPTTAWIGRLFKSPISTSYTCPSTCTRTFMLRFS